MRFLATIVPGKRAARLAGGLWLLFAAATVQAQALRPAASELFPEETVAFLTIADAQDLKARFQESAFGQMSQDPQLKPLMDDLYGMLSKAFQTIEGEVGASLDEISNIPQGEFAVGVVAREGSPPAVVAMLDAGDQFPAVRKLLDRGGELLEQSGASRRTETVEDLELVIYEIPGSPAREVAWFEIEGAVVLGNQLEAVKKMLARLHGEEGSSLSNSPNFAAVRKRCAGAQGDPAQVEWFVDPIALARGVTGDNAGARIALAVLPTLGLDGLLGLGGSVSVATEQFDILTHMHLLLDTPRAGVLEMIALKDGDLTPERWVPTDAAAYMTLRWDVQQTFDSLAKIIDSFQGEGAFARMALTPVEDRLGVNVKAELLPAFTGRISFATLIERTGSLNAQGSLVGLELADPSQFQGLLDKVLAKIGQPLEKKSYGGVSYYVSPQALPEIAETKDRPRKPCLAIVGNYLLGADRESLLERAIVVSSDASQSLAEALDYKLIMSKVSRLSGGKPSATTFQRPEESMRWLYSLASSEQTRQQLRGENRPTFFKDVDQALSKNPLPPFAVIEQYLAPGGGLVTDDDTGVHYMSFTLRRKSGG